MEAHTYAHTHIVLARVQHEENRPAHLVLHTRDKQLKSAPHAGHQSMCCHICSGSTWYVHLLKCFSDLPGDVLAAHASACMAGKV